MTRVIYVNGRYRRYRDAFIHSEDRGFQFGDAVYEVLEVKDSFLVNEKHHIARLLRSLSELSITPPMSARALHNIMLETIRRNYLHNGSIYLQVSRGVGSRNFLFSEADLQPTVVCIARTIDPIHQKKASEIGIKVITHEEIRWARCDIKTVMLLPASLAKEKAKVSGAHEVWFVDDRGMVLEGGSSNAWIINHDNEVLTRQVDSSILYGITRLTLIDVLKKFNIQPKERAFGISEALQAKEAFITSSTSTVMPVVSINGHDIGEGCPGPVTLMLRNAFHSVAEISSN
ncbi:MAG: D-alanine aminotransferase [Hyphomicrobiaceae bacterium hypho_1]